MTVVTSLIRKAFIAVLALMTSLNVMGTKERQPSWSDASRDKDQGSGESTTFYVNVDFFGKTMGRGEAYIAAFANGEKKRPCAVRQNTNTDDENSATFVIYKKERPLELRFKVWDVNAEQEYEAANSIVFAEGEDAKDDVQTITVTGPTPTYQVVFDLNGEGGGSATRTGGGALTQTVSRLDAALAPAIKPQAGYEFVTWDTDFSAVKKDLTVRAVYQIAEVREAMVTFDANGGTVSPSTKTVLKGEAVGELPEPDWPLCTFGGWFTSLNGGTQVTADTVVSGDVTYYAHWTPRPLTVTFNANGGTVSPPSYTVDAGKPLGDNLPTPTRNGHTFAGWWTSPEEGDPVTAETVVSAAVTYYAHWTPIMKTVTFNANGGTVEPSTRKIVMGQALVFLPAPSRRGYTFAGWWTAATGGTQVTAETVVSVDATFYARWTAEQRMTVTFDAVGGMVSPASLTLTRDSSVGELPIPTRNGYTFNGWFTASSGGTPVSSDTVVSVDVTFYAQWTEVVETAKSTVIFYPYDGNDATILEVDRGKPLGELPTPTKTGYVFDGWFTEAAGGIQVMPSTIVAENLVCHAHWTDMTDRMIPTLSTPIITASYDTETDCIRISWTHVPGATRYRVYRATSADAIPCVVNYLTSSTTMYDRMVISGMTYYYTVRALTVNDQYEMEAVSPASTAVAGCAATADLYPDAWEPTDNAPEGGTYLIPTSTLQSSGPHVLYDVLNSDEDNHDFFRVELKAGVRYGFEMGDTDVTVDGISVLPYEKKRIIPQIYYLYRSVDDVYNQGAISTREFLSFKSDSSRGTARFSYMPTASGVYYLRCRFNLPAEISETARAEYFLKYKILTLDEWDSQDDSCANGTVLTPTTALQSHGTHTLDEYDENDFFTIGLVAGKTYVFETTGTGDTYGELFSDISANEAFCVAFDDNGGEGGNFKLGYKAMKSGTYYLRVRASTEGTPLAYSLKYQMEERTSTPVNDFLFASPVGQGWPSACWLSDGRSRMDKTTFTTSDAISVHYAYSEATGYSAEGPVNRVIVLKRMKWRSEIFDVADYSVVSVTNMPKVTLPVDGCIQQSFTIPANRLKEGTYAVLVWLDCFNNVDETDETNNQYVKTFTVSKPQETVTFDANGGTVSETTRAVVSGSTIGSLPTPTRSGYTFDGWYTAAMGDAKVTTNTVVSGNATYYAHWAVKTTATVTFDANGGSCRGGTSFSYKSKIGMLLSLPIAWHTNLLFAGWYSSKDGGVQLENTQYTRVYDDIKLYARWVEDSDRVVVTLDGNGGDVYSGDRHAVAKGSGITEFSYVRRSGYVLDGWFTEPDGGTRVMVSTPVYSNATWYAHWTKAVSSTKPHLEFYFEEEWGDSMMVSDDNPSYKAVSRSSFNTAEGIRVYHEYHWQNFNKDNSPTGLVQVVLLRNRQGTLKQFDVDDYEIKNVTSRLVSSNSIYEDFASYSRNTLEPGDYAVYVILNHDKEIDKNGDFKTQMAQFSEDVYWKMRQFTVEAAPLTVTFDANGGMVSPATRTVAAGSPVGELPIPVWSNWTFTGWRTQRSGGISVTHETVVSNRVTYYAQWTVPMRDSADPKDDTAKGAVNWALKATPTKFDRSLRSDDLEDNFKITGRDGALYDISLAFAEKQVGCDAVFSITNANGQIVRDVNGMPVDHVTSAKQIVLPKTKTPYYLTITHGTPDKRSGDYTISGHYADVGSIKFAKTAVNVKESAAYVDLTVNRTGKDGRVRVRYATTDGTAKAGEDYQATSGILEWTNGDKKAKKIRIPLIPDLVAVYDGTKSKAFGVQLTPFAANERAADEVPAVIAGGDTCTVTIAETSKLDTTVESVYAKQTAKRAVVKTEDVPLESGTFYGLLRSSYEDLTNGFPRLGSITFTASTAKVPKLSAKVSIAGKTYSFSGKGWDDEWNVGWCTLVNVMKVGKSIYTNELYVTVDSGAMTSETDWLQGSAEVHLTMNVPDANGKGVQTNVTYANLYSFYRNNAKIQSYLDVVQKFAGYYTMGLMGCIGGNGYLTMTIDNKGNAKIAGLLPDGTTKPSLSVKACGIREDADSANGYAMYIPVFQAKSPYCFGGEIRLYALRDEHAPDGSGMKIVVDENWSFMAWYNDKDAFGCDFFGEVGFEEGLWTCGGWYDKVVNLQRYYLDYALSVGTEEISEFPYELLPGDDYSFVTAAQPDGFALMFENDKIVHDKKKIVKTNRLTDFALSTNACNVSVKFTRATGLFTGGCSLWCEDGTKQKELTGFKASGVFVLNRQPDDGASCLPDSILAPGCLTKKSKFTLVDEETNRKTSVNWAFSLPFNIFGERMGR